MNEIERATIFAARLAEEKGNDESCWWMSYCDGSLPKGSQFLGVTIIKAKGMAHAVQRAWDMGINPGGEIQAYETDPAAIAPDHFNRLLSKDDLITAGYIDS